MLDIQYIRNNIEEVKKNCVNRRVNVDIDSLLLLDTEVRTLTQGLDAARAAKNANAEAIQKAPKEEKLQYVEKGKELKEQIANLETQTEAVRGRFLDLLMQVPNRTHPDSPVGTDDTQNKEISRFKEPTQFTFTPKDHVTLGQELDILDFETGAKVSGRGFYYLKNEAALLELALIQYAMSVCVKHGYTPMLTPDLARQEILMGTGYQPRGDETQIYSIEGTDLSLIATAEITVAGYYRDHTFAQGELEKPKKIVALSHCFRTEAGAYGKESRGLYRVHQFSKVEMFIFCAPEQSDTLHEELRQIEEEIAQGLGFPYHVVDICTGDLGGPAYRKYDLEAWMPMKNDWGEITSTSNCTDFQARRLNIKHVNAEGKKEYVHTLNGTAVALSRTPIAILENYQNADGTITIPEVLRPFMGGVEKILPKK
ncbi:MAG: serine--tRNA ligase [Candidatus Kerfeldbacteria bacterium]|nr:serine--tRNA ligase [Candidatus Kerfeldbacteria bacterium]